jgi:two-component system, NarL family, nitrate/nitrite response regulator NarL
MTAQTLTLVNNGSSEPDTPSSSHAPAVPTALICDSPLLHSGLRQILCGSPFALIGATPKTGSDQSVAPAPALILIGADQGSGRLIEIIGQVRRHFPEARIVALADQFDLGFMTMAHRVGVDGFCSAASGPEILIKSLEMVMLGEVVIPSQVLRALMEKPSQDHSAEPKLPDLKTYKLSPREAEILGCLREGAPNKVIARKLDITEATIKVHVKAILRKIGASNRTQAAMWASQRLPQQGGASVNG